MKKEIEELLRKKDYESLLDISLNLVVKRNLRVCDICMNITGHTRNFCHAGHKLRTLNYNEPVTLRQLFYYGLVNACYLLVYLDGIKKNFDEIYREDIREIWKYYYSRYYHNRIIGGYWEKKYFSKQNKKN